MIQTQVKKVAGINYYTSSHPLIKNSYRVHGKPVEFGSKVWATSLILLDYLNTQKNLQNQRVLEIGCGWGLVSIFLAKTYNCKVTASDIDKKVLPLVNIQAQANNVEVKTSQLAFCELCTQDLSQFDLLIGSEVCYSSETAQDLVTLVEKSLLSGVKMILLADPGRPDFKEAASLLLQKYKGNLTPLKGSINGKVTYVLSLYENVIT